MSLTAVDRIIAHEVGSLCWFLLPDMHPGLERDEEDAAFRQVWDYDEPSELLSVRQANPLVEYPVIYLNLDLMAGLASAPFLYPPNHGSALRLSDYLDVLRRFLILQLTSKEKAHIPLIWRAVRTLASEASKDELLHFVDQLWRGRWIVGANDWAFMRQSIITGGTPEGIQEVEDNTDLLEAEALRLIQTERQLKKDAGSMDEWLHEAYCLLPDIATWLFFIRKANERHRSDELEKYDRVLDEFLADIGTTLSISCTGVRGGENLADLYAIRPLKESKTIEEAISSMRGIYRGRSIIPRIWYEMAEEALKRLTTASLNDKQTGDVIPNIRRTLPAADYAHLNSVDLAQSFGQAITSNSKKNHWMLMASLFDHWEDDEE